MAEPAQSGDVAQILLAAAEQDLAACEALAQAPGIGDAIVGFHAQQAVEKAIKAVLSRHGVKFRRTHDLALLLDLLHDRQLPAAAGTARCGLARRTQSLCRRSPLRRARRRRPGPTQGACGAARAAAVGARATARQRLTHSPR